MNTNHASCAAPEWAAHMHNEVLHSLLSGVDLGSTLLEIGAGPGAATEWLRRRVRRVVAVEVDAEVAAQLADRFAGANVEVVAGDATKLEFAEASFDSVGTFTMLHHLPTAAQQNDSSARRCGYFAPVACWSGPTACTSNGLHDFHEGDTYNPIEPSALLIRLQTIGFTDVMVRSGLRHPLLCPQAREGRRVGE